MPLSKRETRRIALERMRILFEEAREMLHKDSQLAQRYTELARELGMHFKVRIPREYRRMICRHCKSFILPGVNSRVRLQRTREPHIVTTCLNCGGHMRLPLRRKSK